MIRVLVSGAQGKMGTEVIKAVRAQNDMLLVGGVDPAAQDQTGDVKIYGDLKTAISELNPDVVVDFTHPGVVLQNIKICMEENVRLVVGTTGLTEADINELQAEAAGRKWAVLVAPNFAIGAILMMRFAQEAAKYFADIEIIEYHHNQKKDAPSGTAIKTAEMINHMLANSDQNSAETEENPARGRIINNVNIHSLRLPGYVAHQEVLFSSTGQLLTIRHDSTHRESFMPGVLLAIRKIGILTGVVYGLEEIL